MVFIIFIDLKKGNKMNKNILIISSSMSGTKKYKKLCEQFKIG